MFSWLYVICTMIPRSFCSFSSFSGVLFKLYVKLVFGFILNTAYLLALKCMCHVLDQASYWRSWHSVRCLLLLNNFVSSAKRLPLVLQYSGMSFTKIRKSTGPDIVPCGTPDTTCDHADMLLLDNSLASILLFGVDLMVIQCISTSLCLPVGYWNLIKSVHQRENTAIVPRHKPEDQIESNKMLCLVDTILWSRDMENYKITVVQTLGL